MEKWRREVKQRTSNREQLAPRVEQRTANREQLAPMVEQRTSNREQFSPVVEQLVPRVEQRTSTSEQFSPGAEQFVPRVEQRTSNREQFSPGAEQFMQRVEQRTSNREQCSPEAEQFVPRVEPRTSAREQFVPVVEQLVPRVEQRTSTGEPFAPGVEQETFDMEQTDVKRQGASTQDNPKEHTTRRGIPKYDGVYIKGSIQGVDLTFTADTGATRTIISERIFFKIPEECRPKLEKSASLSGASGQPLVELGKAMFHLKLGELEIDREVIVAEIEDESLLGIDILQNANEGPADILLSQGVIKLMGVTIPCMRVGLTHTRRVRAADHCIIPAQTECVIDVFVERSEEDDILTRQEMVIEATEQFSEQHQVIIAACLVDIRSAVTQKVRIMNPLPTDVSIKQDTVIGTAEQIEQEMGTVVTAEDAEEHTNFCAARRIKYRSSPSPVSGCNSAEHTSPKLTVRSVVDEEEISIPVHLQELYDNASKSRNKEEKKAIGKLLHKYQNSFSKDENDLGKSTIVKHNIDTGDAKPIKQPPRRVPIAFANEEKQVIQQMLDQKIIRKSTSPWASPIVLVRKKNGKVRPCVDYRKFNGITKVPANPLPRVLDCLDAVAGATLFSSFDLTSGYHQLGVEEEDIPKTAFCTKFGLFEYTQLPMGLSGAPATFQRAMEIALQGLQWETCLIYLDDVVVYSQGVDEHLQRVEQMLSRLEQAGLKLKPEKCHLLQEKVNFLGHVVSKDGVLPNPDNVARLVAWPTPKNVTEIRQVLGLGSYYRRFIRGFAEITRPMVELTKKGVKFKWTEKCQQAFDKLKSVLIGPEVMAFPRDTGDFILDCDACDVGIGAVMSQIQDGKERVIAYGSRALNRAERNYCVTDKELLAIRHFIEYYRQYLLGQKFLVRTDHQALVWMFRLKEPKGRVARWLEILSAYSFAIEYRPGNKHQNADALSRCTNPWDCQCPEVDTLEPLKCGPCKKCVKRSEDMQYVGNKGGVYGTAQTEKSTTEHVMMKTTNVDVPERGVGTVDSDGTLDKARTVRDAKLVTIIKNDTENRDNSVNDSTNLRAVNTRGNFRQQGQDTVDGWTSWAGLPSSATLQKLQKKDAEVGVIHTWKQSGNRPSSEVVARYSPAVRHYWLYWDSLEMHDNLLFKRFAKRDGSGSYLQFVVPRAMRQEVMFQVHNSVLSGHLGRKKTEGKTKQKFYWYEMREDIRVWIKKCENCAQNKPPTRTPRAPLGNMATGAPMDRLATDILGPLPETARGNKYILLVTDHFSKWVEIFPVPDQTAVTCARVILMEVISRFGCPLSMHTDQGRNYERALFAELCRLLDIKKTRTTARNPRCNGQAERFNRTLLRMIKAYLKGEQEDWDLHLGCLAAAYRTTPHDSTTLTPNLIVLGREVRLPAELVYGHKTSPSGEQVSSYGEYVEFLRERMHTAHVIARKHLGVSATRQKATYDKNVSLNTLYLSTRGGHIVFVGRQSTREM
jgi:transposase InsO family protein